MEQLAYKLLSIYLFITCYFYNLYVSALEKHTQDKISQKINNNVINVFAQFIYFTEYFYYKLEDEKNGAEASLNKILTYSEKELFKLISDNTFSGIILFSEFDSINSMFSFHLKWKP